MKEKFIRIISPITLVVVLLLDCATVCFSVIAVKKTIQQISAVHFAFDFIMLVVFAAAVLVTKSTLTAGVKFSGDGLEFTAIDNDNVFSYADIERVETKRDSKASLTKNFNDRHSYILLHLTQDRIAAIDIGLTTKRTLAKIEKEINLRKD